MSETPSLGDQGGGLNDSFDEIVANLEDPYSAIAENDDLLQAWIDFVGFGISSLQQADQTHHPAHAAALREKSSRYLDLLTIYCNERDMDANDMGVRAAVEDALQARLEKMKDDP